MAHISGRAAKSTRPYVQAASRDAPCAPSNENSGRTPTNNKSEKIVPISTLIASAWRASCSTRTALPAPRARATAEEMPPPIAPCDMFCINISTGITTATPASTSVPSLARNHVSISPVDDCANIISIFGQLMRASIGTIGASNIDRRRGLAARGIAALVETMVMSCPSSNASRDAWILAYTRTSIYLHIPAFVKVD